MCQPFNNFIELIPGLRAVDEVQWMYGLLPFPSYFGETRSIETPEKEEKNCKQSDHKRYLGQVDTSNFTNVYRIAVRFGRAYDNQGTVGSLYPY